MILFLKCVAWLETNRLGPGAGPMAYRGRFGRTMMAHHVSIWIHIVLSVVFSSAHHWEEDTYYMAVSAISTYIYVYTLFYITYYILHIIFLILYFTLYYSIYICLIF